MQKNTPRAHIEISRKNLVNNILEFRKILDKKNMISVAVKGNAYGHGLSEVVEVLCPYVDYLQVDSVEELEVLRKKTKNKTFVLGFVQKSDLEKVLKLKCILSIFNIEQLKELSSLCLKQKKTQEITLPIDAFLGREGFFVEELPKVLDFIKKNKYLKLTSIYAHFANIEDTKDFSHAQKQIDNYKKAVDLLKDFDFKNIDTHISATSGVLVYESLKNENSIVRIGIGIYGMWPAEHLKESFKKINLKPVLSWKTKIAQIKTLQTGMTIGYGLTYKTTKETKIAVIPQGYADGFDRAFSNDAFVLIKGTRCKILGRVMMNMCVADVSHLKNVKAENEVVLLGKQGKEEITAEEIASKKTINYEITTRISPLLPRIIV
jgi:alanine racemase